MYGSKEDQSPFTRAARSSFSLSCPLPRVKLEIAYLFLFLGSKSLPSLSTALKRGHNAGSAPFGGAGEGGGLEVGGGLCACAP